MAKVSKAEQIRRYAPGYVGGKQLAEEATDKEILAIARAQDKVAKLHNQVMSRVLLKKKRKR